MLYRSLLKKTFLLLLGMSLCLSTFAQNPKNRKSTNKPKNNSFWLDLNVGIGMTTSYDNGTIPFNYNGLGREYSIGFTDEWKRCHIEFEAQRFNTTYSDEPIGTNIGLDARLEFRYSCLKPSDSRWHFWSGVNLETYGELKNLPELQNASSAVSIFGHLGAVEMLSCDFGYNKERTHNWMTAFFKLTLPIAGLVSRPDFMYVHDPLGQNGIVALIANNEKFFKLFPGATTDLGLTLNLRNGNRISLYYTWDYLTTGKKGAYRYDNAYHTVNLSFMFKL